MRAARPLPPHEEMGHLQPGVRLASSNHLCSWTRPGVFVTEVYRFRVAKIATGADELAGSTIATPSGPAPTHGRQAPVPGERSLASLAVVGALGSACILLGVLQPGSPFVSHGRDSWFFTSPLVPATHPESDAQFLGIMLVYLGIALLLGAWYETIRVVRRSSPIHLSRLLPLLMAWAAPIVVAPPLFSRDVYSYSAQGELVTQGLNPYLHGPNALGGGSFLNLVDPLWRNARAPYGPAWERLSGWVVLMSGHSVLGALLGFRVIAIIGVALLAWAVPALARSHGRDGSIAFVLAVLNPLVLLVLVGGSHNDSLMVGLLVAACALASRGHVPSGLLLCALAAEIKAPALIAAAFIGWTWAGRGSAIPQRIYKAALGVLVALVVMILVGAAADLGWNWVTDVLVMGTVVSWLDPATAAGLFAHNVARNLGYHGGSSLFVDSARGIGLAVALVISIFFLFRSERFGEAKALGWSLLVFVLLGPVIWPWYETWGFVFLAVVAERWTLGLLIVLSAVACVADVPVPHLLISAPTTLVVVCWTVLTGLICLYVVARRSFRTPTPRVSATACGLPGRTSGLLRLERR